MTHKGLLSGRWRWDCGLLVLLTALAIPSVAMALGEQPAPVKVGHHTLMVRVPPNLGPRYEGHGMPPFKQIPAGQQRKHKFFQYLAPIVAKINDTVRTRRAAILRVKGWLDSGKSLNPKVRDWLDTMAKYYEIHAKNPAAQVAALKRDVDIIPVSLALAQGAVESAWGTSRFAVQGNNLFGKWCFKRGCGIVPKRRAAGAIHEVVSYPNVAASVRDYIHNLNSQPVYEPLRHRRAEARASGQVPQGSDLAAGLERYSALGQQYVSIIRGVIRVNNLKRFDGD